jgi:hypothetical protein
VRNQLIISHDIIENIERELLEEFIDVFDHDAEKEVL